MNISQSLIKAIFDYKNKEMCGLVLKAKYIDGIKFPSTEVQLLGQYFEFNATGQLPKSGELPVAPKLKSGDPTKKFKDILNHVPVFKEMMEKYGFKIIETGKKIVHEGLSGEIDVVAERLSDNKIVFIDIKTSGLLNDKWNDYGWHSEFLDHKDRLLIQPVQYSILGEAEYGYKPDFYFFVFSNTNTYERKAFKVEIDEARYSEHLAMVDKYRHIINENIIKGWTPYPSPKNCNECPLADKCEHYTRIPEIETVYY